MTPESSQPADPKLEGEGVDAWLARILAGETPSAPAGSERGLYTAREILQQPRTWIATAELVAGRCEELRRIVDGGERPTASLLLTGSGSSHYIGESAAPYLERALAKPVRAVAGGDVLLGQPPTPSLRPRTVVSFGRSGDSPESVAAVEKLLAEEPDSKHLIVTCNPDGRLARDYDDHPAAVVLRLAEETCDRSLVMTSSFTNLLLVARGLGSLDDAEGFVERTGALAAAGRRILEEHSARLAEIAVRPFSRAVYLGDLERWGAAREGALKLLEMTAGRVAAVSEGFLGLRHGPMSLLREDTLLVGFLSGDPLHRAYEMDLIAELDRKRLARNRIFVGSRLDAGLASPDTALVEIPDPQTLGGAGDSMLAVMVSQLLGGFRSLHEGLDPDSPSPGGAISRVVGEFPIHHKDHPQ